MGAKAESWVEKVGTRDPFTLVEKSFVQGKDRIELPNDLTEKERSALIRLASVIYYMSAQELAIQDKKPLSKASVTKLTEERQRASEPETETFVFPRRLTKTDKETILETIAHTKGMLNQIMVKATPRGDLGAFTENAPQKKAFDKAIKGKFTVSSQFTAASHGEAISKIKIVLGAITDFYDEKPIFMNITPSGALGGNVLGAKSLYAGDVIMRVEMKPKESIDFVSITVTGTLRDKLVAITGGRAL